jgi:hypothetical protein
VGNLENGVISQAQRTLAFDAKMQTVNWPTYIGFRTCDGIVAYEEHEVLSWSRAYSNARHLYYIAFG